MGWPVCIVICVSVMSVCATVCFTVLAGIKTIGECDDAGDAEDAADGRGQQEGGAE